jgi:23S rRNA (adenine2503-C2)-methyltransferase
VLHGGARATTDVTTLPAASRASLAASFSLRHGRVASSTSCGDGATKLLVELPRIDATRGGPLRVESVLIRDGARTTLCVSSQAGCSLACSFCRTGTQALGGNLSGADIIEQVLLARESLPADKLTNVVFMGQGEPLLNYRAVIQACHVLTHARGLALPPRRVTVSTSGVAPLMARLARDAPGVRLALSLHAPNDALRTSLMGVNARWPLRVVIDAAARFVADSLASIPGSAQGRGQAFAGARRVRVSFEYVLLNGVNDSDAHARALASLIAAWLPAGPRASLRHAHVNVLRFNAWEGAPLAPSPPQLSSQALASGSSSCLSTACRRASRRAVERALDMW